MALTLANDTRFACPYCSQHLACPLGHAGHYVECPNCGGTLVIPHPRQPVPKSPSAVTTSTAPAPKQSEWLTFLAGLKLDESSKALAQFGVLAILMLGPPLLHSFCEHHPQMWLSSALNSLAYVACWICPLFASMLLTLSAEASPVQFLLFLVFCPVS